MKIDLTEKQFRRLLDLVYVGNWVMNSTRGDDRIREYDDVESTVFAHCLSHGMVPLVESYQGELIPSRAFAEGGIKELTCQSLTNIKHILEQAGLTMGNVVKTSVFLADMNDFAEMNEVYAQFFEAPFPARSAVAVKTLPKNARIEIECIAVK